MHPTNADGIRPNWQKFTLLLFSLAFMAALVILGEAEWSDVAGPFGIIVGYGAANGIGAAKGQTPTPLFVPVKPKRRATDSTEVPVIVPVDSGETVELTPEQHRAAEHARRRAQRPERTTPED